MYNQYEQYKYTHKPTNMTKPQMNKKTCNNACSEPTKCAKEEKTVTHDFKIILGECKVKRNVKITHCVVANVEHTINENVMCKHEPMTKYTTSNTNTTNNGKKCDVKIKNQIPVCKHPPTVPNKDMDTNDCVSKPSMPLKCNKSGVRSHCKKYFKSNREMPVNVKDTSSTNISTEYKIHNKCMHVSVNSDMSSSLSQHVETTFSKPTLTKSNAMDPKKCKKTHINTVEQICTNSSFDNMSMVNFEKPSAHQVCI